MVNWQAAQNRATYQYMNTKRFKSTNKKGSFQIPQGQDDTCELLKVAVDAHAAFLMVAYQMDGANPKPPQRFTPQAFLDWLGRQMQKAKQVVCCYEAGPTGFWLHRRIVALGALNYVVCPTCLDSRRKGVNTDKTDAVELLSRLDRYVAGNKKAFSIVRVPTEEEEKRRLIPRQRLQLRQTRLSLATMGRSLLLQHGWRESNDWWRSAHWKRLQSQLPEWVLHLLEPFYQLIIQVNEQVKAREKEITGKVAQERPVGMGKLSCEQIESEVCDWNRFENRRQVGSYAGLTGGVSASGEQRADLSITKSGNKRLRTTLIEMAWRMLFYQPDYWLVKKWKGVLCNPKAHGRRKKQVIVAFARQLLVDMWKWRTGKLTAQDLGWVMVA
jgi:transposase